MSDINHFSSVVKVLETPKQHFIKTNILLTKFRGEMVQFQKSKLIHVNVWGKLASEVKNSYKQNDYVFIEGYIFNQTKKNEKGTNKIFQFSGVTISRIYPFLLTSEPVDEKS